MRPKPPLGSARRPPWLTGVGFGCREYDAAEYEAQAVSLVRGASKAAMLEDKPKARPALLDQSVEVAAAPAPARAALDASSANPSAG